MPENTNDTVAGLLNEYAELAQITGGDPFRVRNYEKAARSVRGWTGDIGALDVKALRAIPGVGASIASKIAEYLETGHITALDELRQRIPPGVLEVKFAIDSDAHSVGDLGNMPYGVGTAQRGWLTPEDVINTWPLARLRSFLRKGR